MLNLKLNMINSYLALKYNAAQTQPKRIANPSFSGRIVPAPVSRKYENVLYKTFISPIMNYRSRNFTKIRETLAPVLQKVTVPVKNGNITAWEINPENSKKYVLFLHGIKGSSQLPPNQVLLASVMNKGGYGIITPEYRGTAEFHNKTFNIKNTKEDAQATLKYLLDKGIKAEDITIIAHCLGAIPASDLAAEHKNLHKIIFISPLSSGEFFGSAIIKKLNIKMPKFLEKGLNKLTNLFVPYELDMMKSIKDVDAPVVILSPSEDKLISLEQTTQLSKNIKNLSDFVILSKTPHNLTTSSCESIVKYLD